MISFTKSRRTLFLVAALTVAAFNIFGCGGKGDGTEKSGAFTDSRDGQSYRAVKIGGHVWMAENLNYKTDDSYCYGNDDSNCKKYGRLYDGYPSNACPTGWHVPSVEEWNDLIQTVGGGDSGVTGKKLKSKSGWNDNGGGTDNYGFSALPGGSRTTFGEFVNIGNTGVWWTASQTDTEWEIYSNLPLFKSMNSGADGVDESYSRKIGGDENEGESEGFSVRCVQN